MMNKQYLGLGTQELHKINNNDDDDIFLTKVGHVIYGELPNSWTF
jgi:hypothetical protein